VVDVLVAPSLERLADKKVEGAVVAVAEDGYGQSDDIDMLDLVDAGLPSSTVSRSGRDDCLSREHAC
jgi:hypothetical protein